MNLSPCDLGIAISPRHANLHQKRTLSRWAGVNGARRTEGLLYSRSSCARNASALRVVGRPATALYRPFSADAEKRRTDPDFGGAFLDGDFEIMAHAHRKYRQASPQPMAELVAQFAQLSEIRTRSLAIVGVRRDRKQAVQVQMRER